MTILTRADVTGRMSTAAYTRLYARNGGATADLTFLDQCIADAESEVRMLTAAAFPGGIDADGATVDAAITRAAVKIANGLAAEGSVNANEQSSYFEAANIARSFLKRLSRDDDARSVTVPQGRPVPRAVMGGDTGDDGTPTNSYSRARNGQDITGF